MCSSMPAAAPAESAETSTTWTMHGAAGWMLWAACWIYRAAGWALGRKRCHRPRTMATTRDQAFHSHPTGPRLASAGAPRYAGSGLRVCQSRAGGKGCNDFCRPADHPQPAQLLARLYLERTSREEHVNLAVERAEL